jgi:hypothetical protein
LFLFLIQFNTDAQQLIPYCENNKWGYKQDSEVKIKAEYDSAFPFTGENSLAMVCIKNKSKTFPNQGSINENVQFDCFYINSLNQKFKIKDNRFTDSVFIFDNQVNIEKQYLKAGSCFKLIYKNKAFLISKSGKQLTNGFDNISKCCFSAFYMVENNLEFEGKVINLKGLIDTLGNKIIDTKYKQIKFDIEDSSIYCCIAILSNKQNDDVYDFNGALIYSNKKHIAFSSKNIHIMNVYEPKQGYLIESLKPKFSKIIEGTYFNYLGKNVAFMIDNDNWYLLNISSFEKQKINKKSFNKLMFHIISI